MKKKLFAVISIFILALSVFTACAVYAEPSAEIAATYETEAMARFLEIGAFKDRTAGKGNDKVFLSQYLEPLMTSYGYENLSYDFSFFDPLSNDEARQSRNAVFVKRNPSSDKVVVISAYYDNLYAYKDYNDEGAYGGAAGVATWLETARALKDTELPYNAVFVCYSAAKLRFDGAEDFVSKLVAATDKSNILLSMEFSEPVGGEHMYMYSDEQDNDYSDLFYGIAAENGLGFTKVPKYKREAQVAVIKDQILPYTNRGMTADTLVYMQRRIPTVNFLSADWEDRTYPEVREKSGYDNILNTSFDSFDNFVKRVGEKELETQFAAAVNMGVKALTDERLVPEMEKAVADMRDYFTADAKVINIVAISLTAVILIAALAAARSIGNKIEPEPAPVVINVKPNADGEIFTDVFGKEDSDKKDGGSGGDDIFEGF